MLFGIVCLFDVAHIPCDEIDIEFSSMKIKGRLFYAKINIINLELNHTFESHVKWEAFCRYTQGILVHDCSWLTNLLIQQVI